MQQIRFKGEVHLILSDGCKMETKGVVVEARHNTKLHVHSQSEGTGQGKLEVYNDNFELNAALGGTEANNMGSLYIHGGDISVTEIRGYAAIGGGANEELKGGQIDPNSEIVVYGGKLTVNATSCTAGIGGGYFKDQGGPVTIYGGTVDVTGGRSGAGIGPGTYLGGHLFYSNAEIHLADNMKVSYSDH